jgi:hypothetical protein
MNTISTINKVLKKSVRLISKKKFIDKINFKEQILQFTDSIKSDLVKLKLINYSFNVDKTQQSYQHWKFEFKIIFILNDPYIDSKVYESGSVYIFPSKKLYIDINKNCISMFGAYPEWDTNRLTATVTGNARNY